MHKHVVDAAAKDDVVQHAVIDKAMTRGRRERSG